MNPTDSVFSHTAPLVAALLVALLREGYAMLNRYVGSRNAPVPGEPHEALLILLGRLARVTWKDAPNTNKGLWDPQPVWSSGVVLLPVAEAPTEPATPDAKRGPPPLPGVSPPAALLLGFLMAFGCLSPSQIAAEQDLATKLHASAQALTDFATWTHQHKKDLVADCVKQLGPACTKQEADRRLKEFEANREKALDLVRTNTAAIEAALAATKAPSMSQPPTEAAVGHQVTP